MEVFNQKVYSLVKKIPKGKVTTYKILAQQLGNPGYARAVGNALNNNPNLINVPCHRIVKSNGVIGGYRLGIKKKKELLIKERIKLHGQQVENLANYLYYFK